jgi:hypothetical protein
LNARSKLAAVLPLLLVATCAACLPAGARAIEQPVLTLTADQPAVTYGDTTTLTAPGAPAGETLTLSGTSEPWLLDRSPRNYSHGCTRLSNTNITWLYSRMHVGTPVWNVP